MFFDLKLNDFLFVFWKIYNRNNVYLVYINICINIEIKK